MEEYVFKNIFNENIEVKIKAYFYNQAMEILLTTVRNINDYRCSKNLIDINY